MPLVQLAVIFTLLYLIYEFMEHLDLLKPDRVGSGPSDQILSLLGRDGVLSRNLEGKSKEKLVRKGKTAATPSAMKIPAASSKLANGSEAKAVVLAGRVDREEGEEQQQQREQTQTWPDLKVERCVTRGVQTISLEDGGTGEGQCMGTVENHVINAGSTLLFAIRNKDKSLSKETEIQTGK